MAKGLFSQGFCILTDGQTSLVDVESALVDGGFEIVKRTPAHGNWCMGGETLVVGYRPEINGYVSLDVVNRSWPDPMGDPKTEAELFGAWSMGFFGPYAFPGGLKRAAQHAWSWEPAGTISDGHGGFIRIRTSYAFGAKGDSPVLPDGYDPLDEMQFLSTIALALLEAPGALCYFNPNGEVLRDLASFGQDWDACREQEKIPLHLWSNIRFFNLDKQLGFMDTVGNSQLDIRDVEVFFPLSKYEPGDIDYYMRNVSHYLLGLDHEMKSGEAIDGPGETNLSWTLELLDAGIVEPPRRILRLYPKANRKAVLASLSSMGRK